MSHLLNFRGFMEAKKAPSSLLDDEGLQFGRMTRDRQYNPQLKRYAPQRWDRQLEANVQKANVDGFEVYFVDHRTNVMNLDRDYFLAMTEAYRQYLLSNPGALQNALKEKLTRELVGGKTLGWWDGNYAIRDSVGGLGNVFSYEYASKHADPAIKKRTLSAWYLSSPGKEMASILVGENVLDDDPPKDVNEFIRLAVRGVMAKLRVAKVHMPADRTDPHVNNETYKKLVSDCIHKAKQLGARQEMFHVPIIVRYTMSNVLASGTASQTVAPVITVYIDQELEKLTQKSGGQEGFVPTLLHEMGHHIYASLGKEEQDKIYGLARKSLQFSDYGKVGHVPWDKQASVSHESGNEWLSEFFGRFGSRAGKLSPDEMRVAFEVFNVLRHGFSPRKTNDQYRTDKVDKKKPFHHSFTKDKDKALSSSEAITQRVLERYAFDFFKQEPSKGMDWLIKDLIKNHPDENHRTLKRRLLTLMRRCETLQISKFAYTSLEDLPKVKRLVDELKEISLITRGMSVEGQVNLAQYKRDIHAYFVNIIKKMQMQSKRLYGRMDREDDSSKYNKLSDRHDKLERETDDLNGYYSDHVRSSI